MGYTNNLRVVAAICGNFWQESTVNPGIWEGLVPNNPGYGLGQWTDNPPFVIRRTALFDWLDTHGYAHDSGQGQLEFLIDEDLWIPSTFTPSQYSTMSDYFASTSTNLNDLVLEWMYHWEGIDDGTAPVRLTYANRFYNLFLLDDGTRRSWTSGNFYCTETEADYNALLIKDFLYNAVPPPTPPTDDEMIALIKRALDLKKKGATFYIVF